MTKEEIKNLIDLKIAGQGNQVDAGGALSAILAEILGLAAPVYAECGYDGAADEPTLSAEQKAAITEIAKAGNLDRLVLRAEMQWGDMISTWVVSRAIYVPASEQWTIQGVAGKRGENIHAFSFTN